VRRPVPRGEMGHRGDPGWPGMRHELLGRPRWNIFRATPADCRAESNEIAYDPTAYAASWKAKAARLNASGCSSNSASNASAAPGPHEVDAVQGLCGVREQLRHAQHGLRQEIGRGRIPGNEPLDRVGLHQVREGVAHRQCRTVAAMRGAWGAPWTRLSATSMEESLPLTASSLP